jgi:rhodanese-related sulfurtransferase
MSTIALILAALAAVLAYRALLAAREGQRSAEMAHRTAKERIATLEKFVKLMADGSPVTSDMIDDDRLFDEIDSEAARALIEGDGNGDRDVVVVDVRSPEEYESGHIESALWIPIEQIRDRASEVPQQGRVLVFCAIGGRSAGACAMLSEMGWRNLTNVDGGMMAWSGPTTPQGER